MLILENPALSGQSCITQSLYAGLQLIMPGEVAPAHRHAQSALRLVLDGEGAYTAVDGERTTMRRGDFIITPAWTWHDHGNLGEQPVVWLDGLDIPIVRFLDAGFAERSEQSSQVAAAPRRRRAGTLRRQHGAAGLPARGRPIRRAFSSTRSSAPRLRWIAISQGTPDAHHGFKLRYVNPATGASPMPTIGVVRPAAAGRLRDEGNALAPTARCTSALKAVARSSVGDQTWRFQENDVFVVPSWNPLQIRADLDTTLFSYSDRPVQQALGLWREERQ